MNHPHRKPSPFEVARRELREIGMSLHRSYGGEFRVNFTKTEGGTEATAYYTTDLGDAVGTAIAMRAARALFVDVWTIHEYGLEQKLSQAIRCF